MTMDQAKKTLRQIIENQKTVRISRLRPIVDPLLDHIQHLEKVNKDLKRKLNRQNRKIKRQKSALARLNQKQEGEK